MNAVLKLVLSFLFGIVFIIIAFLLGRIIIKTVRDELEGTRLIIIIRDLSLFAALALVAGVSGIFLVLAAFAALCSFKHYERTHPLLMLVVLAIQPSSTTIALLVLSAYLQGVLSVFPDEKQ